MTQWTRSRLMKALAKVAIGMENHMRPSEEFNGMKGGIWTSGEHSYKIDGEDMPAFDYYEYDDKVHPTIRALLNKAGWYAEWNDPGTVILVKC